MKKKNFTLVELLCATALVVILAGIGFAGYSYASHRGKEAATRSLIARIGAGLETLKTKHGFYPASASYGTITVNIGTNGLISSIQFGSDTAINDATQLKDFLAVVDGENLKKYVSVTSGTGTVIDAWGRNIQYQYPGTVNTVKFDLVAPGADAVFGTEATSTPGTTLGSYKENNNASGEWACDDIANFK